MTKRRRLIRLWLWGALVLAWPAQAPAHGGEDHSGQQAAAAPAGAGLTARTARAGAYEITIKHPLLTPDKETAVTVFVTRYETNEAAANAAVTLTLRGADGKSVEVTAQAGAMPGAFTAKLPPLPAGAVQVTARLSGADAGSTADFGAWPVTAPPVEKPAEAAVWARNALIGLVLLTALGLLTLVLRRVLRKPRRLVEEEAAA
jgi:hypothetical protein